MPAHKWIQTSDEDVFKLWLELKNYEKVRLRLALMGDVNPKTGKPFAVMNVQECTYRWMIEHISEAKAQIEKTYNKQISDETWNRYMVKLAMTSYDTSWERQKDWIKRKGMERYEDLWSRFSPTGILD